MAVVPLLKLDDLRVQTIFLYRGGVPLLGKGQVTQVRHGLQVLGRVPTHESRGCSGAASVFPFRLGRQAILAAFLLAQPGTERLCVVPIDIDDWVLLVLWISRVTPGILVAVVLKTTPIRVVARCTVAVGLGGRLEAGILYEAAKFRDRDFVHAKIKSLADPNFVLWFF